VVLAAGAAGLATGGAGFVGTADGGAIVCRGTPGTVWVGSVNGRVTAELWTALCSTAFRTSPGLEICDRSILGLNSSAAGAVARELRPLPGSACSAKYLFTRSASSTSIELECVFFSVTPTLTRTSRMALLFTSSSRARSLIRIFCMPPCFLRIVPPGYDFIASSRLEFTGSPAKLLRTLNLSLFPRQFFLGNVFALCRRPLVRGHLCFIRIRSIFDALDDFGLIILPRLEQVLDAVRRGLGLIR
jgi:hypothetical protein